MEPFISCNDETQQSSSAKLPVICSDDRDKIDLTDVNAGQLLNIKHKN